MVTKIKFIVVVFLFTFCSVLSLALFLNLFNFSSVYLFANDLDQIIDLNDKVIVNTSRQLESKINGEFLLKKYSQDSKGGRLSLIVNDEEIEISSQYSKLEEYQFSLADGDKLVIKIYPKYAGALSEVYSTNKENVIIENKNGVLRIFFEDGYDADFDDLVLDLIPLDNFTNLSEFFSESFFITNDDKSNLTPGDEELSNTNKALEDKQKLNFDSTDSTAPDFSNSNLQPVIISKPETPVPPITSIIF